jgi:signal transduction histidine kinase
MRELSLHILDIAQNSITANANEIRIAIIEDIENDKLIIRVKDDGKGMDKATLEKVVDPFYTTRTTRKVGLGLSLFKASAENCNGKFEITSELGVGTEIDAEFQYSHIDRVPLGNMAETIITIIQSNINIDLIYTHCYNHKKFALNTKDIKKTLGDLPINNMDVLIWLRGYITEALSEIASE